MCRCQVSRIDAIRIHNIFHQNIFMVQSKRLQQYGHVKYRKDGAGEENVDKEQ
jgi:hypothetical protein